MKIYNDLEILIHPIIQKKIITSKISFLTPGRQPQCKTTQMEDNLNAGQPQ